MTFSARTTSHPRSVFSLSDSTTPFSSSSSSYSSSYFSFSSSSSLYSSSSIPSSSYPSTNLKIATGLCALPLRLAPADPSPLCLFPLLLLFLVLFLFLLVTRIREMDIPLPHPAPPLDAVGVGPLPRLRLFPITPRALIGAVLSRSPAPFSRGAPRHIRPRPFYCGLRSLHVPLVRFHCQRPVFLHHVRNAFISPSPSRGRAVR